MINVLPVIHGKIPLVSECMRKVCVVSSHVNGGEFSIGTHTVVITVTDDCGNTSRCIFNVTVVSNCCNIAPIIHCPASIQACTGSSIDPATTGKPSVSKGSPACKEPQLNYTDKLNFYPIATAIRLKGLGLQPIQIIRI